MNKKNIIISGSLVAALIVIVAIVLVVPHKTGSEEITQQEGIGVIPEEARIHNERGLSYYTEAKFQLEAKRKFDEANLKYEEAVFEFEKAIEIAPNYAEAHANLGRVYVSQKRFSDAVVEYERVVSLNPDYYKARLDLASAYEKAGRYDDAIEQLNIVISSIPDGSFKQGLRDAIEQLESAKK